MTMRVCVTHLAVGLKTAVALNVIAHRYIGLKIVVDGGISTLQDRDFDRPLIGDNTVCLMLTKKIEFDIDTAPKCS